MTKNLALISIKTYSSHGEKALKDVLANLCKKIDILRISSVYRVQRRAESLESIRDIRKEEMFEGLATVISVETLLPAEDLFELLISTEREMQKEVLRRTISLNLLTYNDQIIVLPSLAVPHPELHLRPEELVLAGEINADYIHPVLNKSLKELARNFSDGSWGEFYLQGSTLLGDKKP